jgi:hypothetical protein
LYPGRNRSTAFRGKGEISAACAETLVRVRVAVRVSPRTALAVIIEVLVGSEMNDIRWWGHRKE